MGPPPERTGVSAAGAGRVLDELVPGCGGFARLEDGSECGALGVGQGWGVGDEVLDVRGEGIGVWKWRRGGLG